MKTLEILKTRKEEIIEATLKLMPTALSGDAVTITFYVEVNELTNELSVDYYFGHIQFDDNCYYTIESYEVPVPEYYGYESIEEMNFGDCGYSKYIEHAIEDQILNLENQACYMYTNSGEKVQTTKETRNLGHGEQVKVIYSDGSYGWEHVEDLQD